MAALAASLVLMSPLSSQPSFASVFSCDANGKNCFEKITDAGVLTQKGADEEDAEIAAKIKAKAQAKADRLARAEAK